MIKRLPPIQPQFIAEPGEASAGAGTLGGKMRVGQNDGRAGELEIETK
jgi:hypothetical protein